jgi:hypothetical protein
MSAQFYTIENNEVILSATKWFDSRVLTTVDDKNKDGIIGHLTDKYTEIANETMVLKAEYINSTDKLKMAGKINRHRTYLATAKAIGDFSKLFEELDTMETEISKVVETNVAQRVALLSQTESIIADEAKDWKGRTEAIAEIAKKLKDLPTVPDIRVEEIKQKFDKIRDEFFIKKNSFFEDQEKIFLDNLDHKIELCEKAEALAASTEWKKTTEAIAELNEAWKKIGPVPRHRNEELWARFNHAKDIFFEKKKAHYETVKTDQESNLKIKLELCEKAEAIKDSRDWKKTTDEYNNLMTEWKKSGRVSNEMNDEVWNRFNAARNHFFTAKESYYGSIKLNLEDNFTRKSVIVKRTEELATEAIVDWEGATQEILEMSEEWRKIGRIAKEHGDELWERFLKAKKDFFDRKDAEREKRRAEGSKALDEKTRRNRGFLRKLERELELENEVLWDFSDRLKNLMPSARSFEAQERYEAIIKDAEKKVNSLKAKIKDVRANLEADEKEFKFLTRPFKKKEDKVAAENTDTNKENKPASKEDANVEIETKETANTNAEVLSTADTNTENNTDANSVNNELPQNEPATAKQESSEIVTTVQEPAVSNNIDNEIAESLVSNTANNGVTTDNVEALSKEESAPSVDTNGNTEQPAS